jgi:hypothetical protein
MLAVRLTSGTAGMVGFEQPILKICTRILPNYFDAEGER